MSVINQLNAFQAESIKYHAKVADIFVMLILIVDYKVLDEVMQFADSLSITEPVDFNRHGGKGLKANLVRSVHEFERENRKLLATNGNHESIINNLCDVFDNTDELIDSTVNEINEYFRLASHAKTLSSPKHSKVYEHLTRAVFWLNFAYSFYKKVTSSDICPIIDQASSYRFLNMESVFRRLVMMADHISRLDSRSYNIDGIITSERVKKHISSLMEILMSASFVDRVYTIRDGQDPHFRDKHRAIVSGVRGIVDIDSVKQSNTPTE